MGYKNDNHLYFTIKGVAFKQTGIRNCTNGSWQVSIKNVSTGKFSDIGYEKLQRILKNINK